MKYGLCWQGSHSRASSTYRPDQHASQQHSDLFQRLVDVTAGARLSTSSLAPDEPPHLHEGWERRSAAASGLVPAGKGASPSQSLSRLNHSYSDQPAREDAVLHAFDELWHGGLNTSS